MTDPYARALRSRPPAQAIHWVEQAVGHGARVTSVSRLSGGDSSALHALTVVRGGQPQRLVLRRFVRADWLAEEPDLAAHEAAALRLLEGAAVPAPRVIAVDEDGATSGGPSVLMTRLPGRTVLAPSDMESWLAQMAAILPHIHSVQPAPDSLPWTYEPYNDVPALRVPVWARRQGEWERALAVARSPAPPSAEHLIHRDYHAANVLWSRGGITGIVDWVNACRGPAGVDIGHCRRNLALLHSVAIADRFLDYCLGWAAYDPYWDILTLTDWLPDAGTYAGSRDVGIEVTAEAARARADEYVVSLVARL